MGYDLKSRNVRGDEGYFRITTMAMAQIIDILRTSGLDDGAILDKLKYNNGQTVGKRAAQEIASGIRKWAATAVPGETEIVNWNITGGFGPVEANYIKWFLEFAEFNEKAAPYRVS